MGTEMAPAPKHRLWVPDAGHNDLQWVAGERYWDALRRFADSLPDAGDALAFEVRIQVL